MKKKVDDKLLEKIQKLFKLGESPNMNEATAALKKAEALMAEYDLSYGQVNFVTEHEPRRNKKKIYEWEHLIFANVCLVNNCVPASSKNRYFGEYSLAGRKINVFLSIEMFRYLTNAVDCMAKKECKGKGHKYNHDFKMAAAMTIADRLNDYGDRVSWAVDRETEIKNIKEFRKLKPAKKAPGEDFTFLEGEAVNAGIKAGNNISLHKQAGLSETKLIGA